MMLDPSPQRVDEIDRRLRDRLSGSLDYLGTFLADGSGTQGPILARMRARLAAGPVSPWVFGAYAQLVQDLSNRRVDAAHAAFALLDTALALPAVTSPVALNGPDTARACWDVAHTLFDTDHAKPFAPRKPTDAEAAACVAEIDAGMALLADADPACHAELRALQRVILLGCPRSDAAEDRFNGASTFFLWGGVLLNAAPRRNPAMMLDLLVHEASHMLLFGLVDGGALSENDPAARYSSPLRQDPRPIDGIFHAAFVATRVHLVMTRMLIGRRVPVALMPALAERADANGRAAVVALALLRTELRPTPAGKPIFDALAAYWLAANVAHA